MLDFFSLFPLALFEISYVSLSSSSRFFFFSLFSFLKRKVKMCFFSFFKFVIVVFNTQERTTSIFSFFFSLYISAGYCDHFVVSRSSVFFFFFFFNLFMKLVISTAVFALKGRKMISKF